MVYVGLRDVDEEEQELIDGGHAALGINPMRQYNCADVGRLGIERVMRETLEYFDSRGVTD